MADNNSENKPETFLIALATVYLLDGTGFELYPFIDANDVKGKVSELAEGWSSSGFLLRDSHLIPWHQVKLIETTSVEELSKQEVQKRLDAWHAEDERRAIQNFWKTKKHDKKEDGDKSEGDQGKKGE